MSYSLPVVLILYGEEYVLIHGIKVFKEVLAQSCPTVAIQLVCNIPVDAYEQVFRQLSTSIFSNAAHGANINLINHVQSKVIEFKMIPDFLYR